MTQPDNPSCHPRESGDPVTADAGKLGLTPPRVDFAARLWRRALSAERPFRQHHRLLAPRFRGDDSERKRGRFSIALKALAASGLAPVASAALAAGPKNWQIGFGEPGSEIETLIVGLHGRIILIGSLIVVLVLGLLLFVAWRFHASRHPDASRVARAPVLEFGWTVLPIVILGAIAVPSLAVLRYEADIPPAELTLKVTGFQWFWRYEYPDHEGVVFDSLMLPPNELNPGQPRLLEVDSRVVVPTGAVINFLVTSGDVVHSFFIPTLGLQIYAVPGKLNQTWVRIDRPGVYYGQCNQICGLDHSFMPIAIDARSPADFAAWLAETRAPAPPPGAAPAGTEAPQ
jgi:cytochrome c oxidase subunit 2